MSKSPQQTAQSNLKRQPPGGTLLSVKVQQDGNSMEITYNELGKGAMRLNMKPREEDMQQTAGTIVEAALDYLNSGQIEQVSSSNLDAEAKSQLSDACEIRKVNHEATFYINNKDDMQGYKVWYGEDTIESTEYRLQVEKEVHIIGEFTEI
ncbi:hypothetical protein [Candidatus Tisiphia endosymbiont of Nemotelus uliginosus]|uniref:hypothetical protein n=1 Tax=Candidatus Tisiphia endosymbiont of Nemotelus uliginosus TaxID=3077926 RepID=UPI0035C8CAD1